MCAEAFMAETAHNIELIFRKTCFTDFLDNLIFNMDIVSLSHKT